MKICAMEWESVCGSDLSFSEIEKMGEVSYHGKPAQEEIAATIGDAEVLLCSKVVMTGKIMDACPKLKYIGLTATGFNNIDLAAATARGITVTNIPDYSSDAVAQLTFSFLLQFATSLHAYAESTARGDWTRSPLFCYYKEPITELCGKTLGLFGLGSIGKKVARIGEAFGMKVIYHARKKKDVPYEFVSREELFARSDFLSLHAPATPETEKVVCRENLQKMKKTAYLINTARGSLVNEKDVREALDQGLIAGFAADVLEFEPQREDCPLIGAKNVILTPHIAWAPKETRQRLLGILKENLAAYLAGSPQNVVNSSHS